MENTAKNKAQNLKIHYEQFLDSAWPQSQNEDFLNLSFFKEFSQKQDDLSVKSKKLLSVTKHPHSGQTTSLPLNLRYHSTWQKDLKSTKHSASNLLFILQTAVVMCPQNNHIRHHNGAITSKQLISTNYENLKTVRQTRFYVISISI